MIIIEDRYTGAYSGSRWTAWDCSLEEIPKAVEGEDAECREFWEDRALKVGKGNSVEEACLNLLKQLKQSEA